MENRKYKVLRDNVYAGQIVQNLDYQINSDEKNKGIISLRFHHVCRNIIFTIDSENRADDLLFNSPRYPISNVTSAISDEEKVRKMNRLMVESAVNLAPILEYLGYKSKLGYEDILKIRKQLFTNISLINGEYLFNFGKIKSEHLPCISQNLLDCLNSQGVAETKDFKLPSANAYITKEYFEILSSLGDSQLPMTVTNKKGDLFKPDKTVEGKIKKLKHF